MKRRLSGLRQSRFFLVKLATSHGNFPRVSWANRSLNYGWDSSLRPYNPAVPWQARPMAQTSPPQWHIIHVSWFFAAFVPSHFLPSHQAFHPRFIYLFNRYYYTVGAMHPRPQRGLLLRPPVQSVYAYRTHLDEQILNLVQIVDEVLLPDCAFRISLGLNHEQQHQELLFMDIKRNFFINPLKPAYHEDLRLAEGGSRPVQWLAPKSGLCAIGDAGNGLACDEEYTAVFPTLTLTFGPGWNVDKSGVTR